MPEPGHLDIPLTTEKNINTFKDAGGSQESETSASNVQKVASALRYPESQDEVYKARIRFKVFKINPLEFKEGAIGEFGDSIKNVAVGLMEEAGQLVSEGVDQALSLLPQGGTSTTVAQDVTQGLVTPTQGDPGEAIDEKTAAQLKSSENTGDAFNRLIPVPDLEESVVSMFVPVSVTFNDGAQYDDTAALGITGGAAMSGLEGGSGVVGSLFQGITSGAASMIGLGDNTGISGGDIGRVVATRLAQMAPVVPQGVKNAVSLTTQTSLNPNTRPLFRNVNIRTFTFTFKMIPESKREAAVVEKIVKHFRKNVYPEVIPEGVDGFSIAYRFPKLFDISFDMNGKKMGIPKIEKCYLRNVSVTYNSTAATFHEDGQPNEVDMTLTFVERKTLSRRDIEVGGL